MAHVPPMGLQKDGVESSHASSDPGEGHSGTEWLPTAARSGGGKHQNLGAVDPSEGKKGGGQLQTENLISMITCKMCLVPLYFVIYMVFIVWKALTNNLDHFCR